MAKSLAYGLKLYVEDDANPGTYLAVANLTNAAPPGATKARVDMTDLDSTGKEYLPDIPDYAEVSYTGRYNPSSTGQMQCEADGNSTSQTTRNWRVEKGDINTRWSFAGYVASFVPSGAQGNPFDFEMRVQASGSVTKGSIS